MTGMQAVAKWRAGFRVPLVRTPALLRSRREEVGSLARVYARFAPNFGRGAGHQGWAFCRERQHRLKSGGFAVSDAESPPDFPARRGPEPSGRSEMDQLGPKTGRVQPRSPPLWNFATACPETEKCRTSCHASWMNLRPDGLLRTGIG